MKFIPLVLLLTLFSCANESRSQDLKNVKPGKLEFFETYSFSEIMPSWQAACKWIKDHDTLALQGNVSMQEKDQRGLDKLVRSKGEYAVGYVLEEDMPKVDALLNLPEVKKIFAEDLRFLWSYGVEWEDNGKKLYALYAIKMPVGNKSKVSGKDIKTAEASVSQVDLRSVINITMTDEGAQNWEIMTFNNVGRAIAITLDDQVLSCPVVNDVITGGKTEISGNFNQLEAKELAARIYAGKK